MRDSFMARVISLVWWYNIRSSRTELFCKKMFLNKYFTKCTGKCLCQSLFFNEVTGLGVCNFVKKETLVPVFSMHLTKFSL